MSPVDTLIAVRAMLATLTTEQFAQGGDKEMRDLINATLREAGYVACFNCGDQVPATKATDIGFDLFQCQPCTDASFAACHPAD